ncbi:hypothetical protein BRADI_5g15104v3 [Brachypodium distachyon]|uniref:DUF3741 domain-containing protein n=1 Tax=Brachypodium distachyon TaxID=15368 RepID=A0A0Q3KTC0_BRADI|nr:hypothetical protein BRADI_5g15104v3 [Brachypodium distachyon]KQJ83469.1 hypothetical protein BRADI_5g15104v3 [Brachypodium distachyon]PNT61422.1 hypothetical protein BRADI_5g15104v3 [Brachypodium distachyon]PNT61426.1 hypothetical protein BRADI_5g15104v3 [Brachypodium distachyon]
MINLFDLSTGMTSTKVLTDRAYRDGSPVRRIWQDTNPAKVCAENKLGANSRNSSNNKSDAPPMKMLLVREIFKEAESRKKPPSVVARLMGLEDDLPAQEPALLHSVKRNLRSQSHANLAATNRPLLQQERHCYGKSTHHHVDAAREEPLRVRTHHHPDQTLSSGRSSRKKSDTRTEVVRKKFMEAKLLANDENFLHSKEFQEALEVLSSNKDLFLKFLEEPSSVSKPQNEHQTMPAPLQKKCITLLKPLKSVENKGERETRTHRFNEENGCVTGKTHKRSHSTEDTFSQPTRIVVLKPSPGKPNRTHARLTPRTAPSEQTDKTNFLGDLEDDACASTLRYGEVSHASFQYLPEDRHRRDESLLSSVYSNGYFGDESSFSRSEIDYIDENDGNLSDSVVVSPVSRYSWDYIKRHSSTHSCSNCSRTSHSHSAESSVTKEAKKRLSERWTTVARDEIGQEIRFPRNSRTLGDMLSLKKDTKEETVALVNSVSTSQSCGTGNEWDMQATRMSTLRKDENGESSPRNLVRSKSLPASSAAFHDIIASANSEVCKTSKMDTRSGKGKSLKGRVSSFFFPRNKRLATRKTILTSDGTNGKVEVTFLGDVEQMTFCKDKSDSSTIQTNCSSKDVDSFEALVSSDCPGDYTDDLRSNGGLKCMRGHPSPTFEDNNTDKPESSRSIISCNKRVGLRSPAIESVARSLPWEDTNSRSALLGSLNFSNADDDDELECHAFVEKILSSSGLDNLQLTMVFTGWYLPDCPLDPELCHMLLDHNEEAAKSRECRSNRKLLFDCVNMALVEAGQDALLSTYPWSKTCLGAWKEKLSQDLREEVWSHVKGWLYGAEMLVANKDGDTARMLERVVQQEVEGGGWMKSGRSGVDEVAKLIASCLLEDLVGEAVADLAVCFPQQGIPLPMSSL